MGEQKQMEEREVLYIQADGPWGGRGRGGGVQKQDTKQVGVASGCGTTSACTKPHSEAPWLGDLRVNNAH